MKKHITLFVQEYRAENGVKIASIPGQNQIRMRDLTPAEVERTVAELGRSKHAESFHATNGELDECTITETCLIERSERTWVWKRDHGARLWKQMTWHGLPWIPAGGNEIEA